MLGLRDSALLGSAAVLASALILVAALAGRQIDAQADSLFRYQIIDSDGPSDPWGKSVGDLNADGRPDLVVGGHGSGELVWYANPDWARSTIATGEAFSTDHEVADLDGDGRNDVVSLTRSGLFWYRSPDWTPSKIATVELHDIEVGDLDGDGDLDLVGRDQSAFGGSGATLFLYYQETPGAWREATLSGPEGEGLELADLNADGYPDVAVNGQWFENPGAGPDRDWTAHVYSGSWTWPHTFIDSGDIDKDGRIDLVLVPAEPQHGTYRVSWFRAPADPSAEWTEMIVSSDVETVMHFVGLADLDVDGDLDIVAAEMFQSEDPDEIIAFLNAGRGDTWAPLTIATSGSHSMRLEDLDLDGDPDLFGANWSGEHQAVELWENLSCPQPTPWRRHVLDDELPWTAVFVTAADIDQDGLQDVLAGAWWYRNPGHMQGQWRRRPIARGFGQIAAVLDHDRDGKPDAIGTNADEGVYGGRLLWARNLGGAAFDAPKLVAETEGDFLQGVAIGDFDGSKRTQIALSWHGAGMGVQGLTAAADDAGPWQIETLSPVSQDEALSAGDIDRDGDLDLLLGTIWLENGDGSWTAHELDAGADKPDRNRLADVNGDGRLDAVVGFEALSVSGDLVVYEQPADPTQKWDRRVIASLTGPMSLDVIDLDQDGDLDVLVGEHNMEEPEQAGIFWFSNADGRGNQWERHLIYRGDEHHDGAQAVDLDNDGDLDVVSIGWGHNKVVVYENRRGACRSAD